MARGMHSEIRVLYSRYRERSGAHKTEYISNDEKHNKSNHVGTQNEPRRASAEMVCNSRCRMACCIQRAARAIVSARTDTADSTAVNAPGTRKRSHQSAQSATRRLKYHAGSSASARRCHLSSCAQVPCSSRRYSSVSVGTTGCNRI
jgi:hypothetical protein